MTQTSRGKYVNGLATKAKILRTLALNKDFAQHKLPEKVDVNYRQVVRVLNQLEKRDLVHISRTVQSSMGGRPRNFWEITFYGLMEVLKYLSDKKISSVAGWHSDKWLVFQEWSFFLKLYKEHRFLLYTTLRYISKQFYALEAQRMRPFTNVEIREMGYTREEWERKDVFFKKIVLENIKQEYTDLMLSLSFLRKRFLLKHPLLSNEYKKVWLPRKSEMLATYSKNPRIKQYIIKRFEDEEAIHGLLCELKTQWLERGE